jgi:hypothetical protein
MNNRKLMATVLIGVSLTVSNVLAQPEREAERRWTIQAYYTLDIGAGFNSRGLENFLRESDFDADQDVSFFGVDLGRTEHPAIHTEDAAWSVLATYGIQPKLSIGGFVHQTVDVEVAGFYVDAERDVADGITLQQTARAAGPVVLWKVGRVLSVGGGPAFVWGGTAPYQNASAERVAGQETLFWRPGAVGFVSLGFTVLNQHIYLGLQGQFLYAGKAEVGPFLTEESLFYSGGTTLEKRAVRLSQLTMGPVIALNI